jgi:hypothetical protein
MTKKPLNQLEGNLEWLKNEVKKDQIQLESEKLKFLDEIKKHKKEDIVPVVKVSKKLSLWGRIKKVLMG